MSTMDERAAGATVAAQSAVEFDATHEFDGVADGIPAAADRPRGSVALRLLNAVACRPVLVDLIAISILALLARAIFYPALDNDPTYSLIWGRDVVHGRVPDLGYSLAPTAHPLATLEGSLAALLGRDGAVDALLVVSYWCLGALLWGVFRLGEAGFSRLVGILALVLVGSNFITIDVAVGGFLDVPFVALLVWAAALEVRRPRRGVTVLMLLALAGTLRPEAWLLAALYWAYLYHTGDRRLWLGLLVLLAPLTWVLMGLIVTGKPLFAFTNARQPPRLSPATARRAAQGSLRAPSTS